MVLAYHIIFTAYGFWLPNDPRGSWSDFVWSWELACYGEATMTRSRCSVAAKSHDRDLRQAAKRALLYPPVHFDGEQARAIRRGFADACDGGGYVVSACSILPEHVHMVVRRHPERQIEKIGNHFKARATTFLTNEQLHPLQHFRDRRGRRPSPWSESFWQVYLNSDADIRRAVQYVQTNPVKDGLRPQRWWFAQDGKLPGPKAGAKLSVRYV